MRMLMKKKLDSSQDTLNSIKGKLDSALTSADILFGDADIVSAVSVSAERSVFKELFIDVLQKIKKDLIILEKDVKTAQRLALKISVEADSINAVNKLAEYTSDDLTFCENIEALLLDSLIFRTDFYAREPADLIRDAGFIFFMKHLSRLWDSVAGLIPGYISLLAELCGDEGFSLLRIRPDYGDLSVPAGRFAVKSSQSGTKFIHLIEEKAAVYDPFIKGRAFRYIDGGFQHAELSSIRQADAFYGYASAKHYFKEFFNNFLTGKGNVPLLISSLPGLGKTQFTISYTMLYENLTLILAEPSDLERPLEGLIRKLAYRKNHRFVIFFDDINPAKIDWYFFRTNIGGCFALPSNIAIVIASNFEFPANILSRGRSYVFPMFDEIRCQEMIENYLVSKGMRKPSPDLVSVMAADYVEEFAQKAFEELSPRTLVRYLERYEKEPAKRKHMLELASQEIIARPDAQLFFDTNVKLMRALYGESAIDELQKRQLGN